MQYIPPNHFPPRKIGGEILKTIEMSNPMLTRKWTLKIIGFILRMKLSMTTPDHYLVQLLKHAYGLTSLIMRLPVI